ncbi:gamma-glutamylcyclotransferase [Bacillus daqingensis]|uniref:Gamma-glutamylcyclotransferase family protein n=1 Tax=Bacillus daqingensis TaxID=872396 RepID=A0ABV9NQX2_9BACI
MKLFVYGTLMTGEGNHFFLRRAKLLNRQARVNGSLYDTGLGYPALVRGAGEVWGELYAITSSQLPAIDELEGYQDGRTWNLYSRETVDAFTENGTERALVYYYNKPVKAEKRIASGSWKTHRISGS